eukprot:TRINITY_DN87143_c0_g1_i1.p1 TRINITY_DN87143_c0_g1~~TRINITY_DN87143_c0_g1_i1.p1  ORF type:complete len:489 (-),score=73.00 TRINITY_DN87143_c0_g1_i1:284-1750(-)
MTTVAIVFMSLFVWKVFSVSGSAAVQDVQDRQLLPGPGVEQRLAAARSALSDFVSSLGDGHIKNQVFYPDAELQDPQWLICTIVQQCGLNTAMGEPKYGLAIGNLSIESKVKFFTALAGALEEAPYMHLQGQQVANLALMEYQRWATFCPGTCLKAPAPMRAKDLFNATKVPGVSFEECGRMNMDDLTSNTTWICHDTQLALFGNLDMTTGEYLLGNIFTENEIHARNDFYDFVSVYGDLSGTGDFGFRYSGHHYDVNFRWHDGKLDTMPAFFGHNPIKVLRIVPPSSSEENGTTYDLWRNFNGMNLFQFPDILQKVFAVSRILPKSACIPLSWFDSTPATGGLTLSDGKTISDLQYYDLSGASEELFAIYMDLVEYTVLTRRDSLPSMDRLYVHDYVQAFRKSGKMIWTSITPDRLPTDIADLNDLDFFYVQIETDDWLYFAMLNQMFTFVAEKNPSNHLHSMLTPKFYLNGVLPGSAHDDHGHAHR